MQYWQVLKTKKKDKYTKMGKNPHIMEIMGLWSTTNFN